MKNPTENAVGNRFNTKVPSIPSSKCMIPVQMEAMTRAVEPPLDWRLITKEQTDGELHEKRTASGDSDTISTNASLCLMQHQAE